MLVARARLLHEHVRRLAESAQEGAAQAGGQAISLATLMRVLTDPVLLPAYLVVFFIAAIRDVFHGSAHTVSAGMPHRRVVGRVARRGAGGDGLVVFAGIAFGSALAGLLYARYGYHANLLGSLDLLLLAAAFLALSARRAQVPGWPHGAD